MFLDLALLLALVLLNGAFAMSEIAIVGSKRARLLQLAEDGSSGAQRALKLSAEPTRFLSSVQVGITSIGILNGAIGGASIAGRLRVSFQSVPLMAPYADGLALASMVAIVTYVSLILGELVPKRIALAYPEGVATVIAQPMDWLARAGRPIVTLLSVSTDAILRLLRVRHVTQPGVTLEELRVMLEQGTEEGVFEASEHEMVSNVLNLDDRQVGSVLTPRSEIVYLDVNQSLEAQRTTLRQQTHSVLPLCEGGLEHVIGFVRATHLLDHFLNQGDGDLRSLAEPGLFVPETMTLMTLLEQFKRTHLPVALVVDEFGDTQGLVSLTDVTSAIVGDLPTEPNQEPLIVRREDGGWLMDGSVALETVLRTLEKDALLSDEEAQHYHTLGGLAMAALGRVPRTGDVFERSGHRFEVVDMDGNRVDRVLVRRSDAGGQATSSH
jgi:putative hemolysin